MIKRLILGMFAVAGLLATSCSSDDDRFVIAPENAAQVTFDLGLEGATETRAISDGKSVDKLVYAVYDANGDIIDGLDGTVADGQFVKTGAFTDLKESVKVTLAKGQEYTVLFWAQDEDCAAYTTSDLENVTVSYDAAVNNDETRDAFYAAATFTVTGNQKVDVTMKRPFAQINVGVTAEDWAAAEKSKVVIKESKVVIKEAATTINLKDGSVGNPVDVTYDFAAIPTEGLTVNTDNYKYLSMSYILVNDATTGADKATVELAYTFRPENGADFDFSNGLDAVPVQRNYRTNIVGTILTGEVTLDITIDPIYAGDNNFDANWKEIADGVYQGRQDESQYLVTKGVGFEWISEQMNDANANIDGFAGKTIKLGNDIDLSAENWDPIGDNSTDEYFKGTFDGDDHLIKGLHITGDFCWDGSVYGSKEGWGLFAATEGATIKNVKLDGVTLGSYTVITGAVTGYAHNTTFENIEISNTKIAGYNWYTGGVTGWASGNCTFKGIKMDETVAVGSLWDSHGQNAGGIAGGVSSSGTYLIEDCEIACVMDVINDVTSNYKYYIYRVSGMLIGNVSTTQKIGETTYPDPSASNITCKNVTVTYGEWMNYHYCQGYGNRGWGRVEESDYVGFGIVAGHTHDAGQEHHVVLPFDQLFGGGPNGDGRNPVNGLREYDGVTVNYPTAYTCTLCGQQHNN